MSRYATYGKKSIFHPTPALEAAVANRTPRGFSGRANEYRCPLGRSVGRGWLLMLRSHLDSLDLNAWHPLSWFSEFDNLLVNLAVARAVCMNQSNDSDPDALYLVVSAYGEDTGVKREIKAYKCFAWDGSGYAETGVEIVN